MIPADGILLTAVVALVVTAWHSRHPIDDDTVTPRPFLSGGRYWHNGRECFEWRDDDLAQRAVAARRLLDDHREAA